MSRLQCPQMRRLGRSVLASALLLVQIPSAGSFPANTQAGSAPDFATLAIPDLLGQVDQVHLSPSANANSPWIIFIQDAHNNYTAQKNTSGILQLLHQRYGVSLTLVEGAEGDVDLSFLRGFGTQSARESVAEDFLEEGVVAGEEFTDMATATDLRLWGVEDLRTYAEAYNAYRYAEKQSDELKPLLGQLRQVLALLAQQKYSKDLRQLNARLQSFEEDPDTGFSNKVLEISRQAAAAGLDLEQYPNLNRFFEAHSLKVDLAAANEDQKKLFGVLQRKLDKLQLNELLTAINALKAKQIQQYEYYQVLSQICARNQVSLDGYPALSAHIRRMQLNRNLRVSGLLKESIKLTWNLRLALAGNSQTRQLVQVERQLELFEKLISLEFSSDDYEEYRNRKEDWAFDAWFQSFNSMLPASEQMLLSTVDSQKYQTVFERIEDFYRLTFDRDREMSRRIADKLHDDGDKAATLIVGGFHTDHLTEELNRRGFNVTVVVPMAEAGEEAKEVYRRQLTHRNRLLDMDEWDEVLSASGLLRALAMFYERWIQGGAVDQAKARINQETLEGRADYFSGLPGFMIRAARLMDRWDAATEVDRKAIPIVLSSEGLQQAHTLHMMQRYWRLAAQRAGVPLELVNNIGPIRALAKHTGRPELEILRDSPIEWRLRLTENDLADEDPALTRAEQAAGWLERYARALAENTGLEIGPEWFAAVELPEETLRIEAEVGLPATQMTPADTETEKSLADKIQSTLQSRVLARVYTIGATDKLILGANDSNGYLRIKFNENPYYIDIKSQNLLHPQTLEAVQAAGFRLKQASASQLIFEIAEESLTIPIASVQESEDGVAIISQVNFDQNGNFRVFLRYGQGDASEVISGQLVSGNDEFFILRIKEAFFLEDEIGIDVRNLGLFSQLMALITAEPEIRTVLIEDVTDDSFIAAFRNQMEKIAQGDAWQKLISAYEDQVSVTDISEFYLRLFDLLADHLSLPMLKTLLIALSPCLERTVFGRTLRNAGFTKLTLKYEDDQFVIVAERPDSAIAETEEARFDLAEIRQVLAENFDIQNVSEIEPLGQGMNAAAFRVRTADGRDLVLRRSAIVDDAVVLWDEAIRRRMAQAEVEEVNPFVATTTGEFNVREDDQIWTLMAWAEGEEGDWGAVDGERLRAAGAALARFHDAASDDLTVFETIAEQRRGYLASLPVIDIDNIDGAMERLEQYRREMLARGPPADGSLDAIFLGHYNFYRGQLEALRESINSMDRTTHRQTVLHGDYHPKNVRFLGQQLSQLFDFDYSHLGPRILDLASVMIESDSRFDPDKARLFIEGYQRETQVPLTPEEMDFLETAYRRLYLQGVLLQAQIAVIESAVPEAALVNLIASTDSLQMMEDAEWNRLFQPTVAEQIRQRVKPRIDRAVLVVSPDAVVEEGAKGIRVSVDAERSTSKVAEGVNQALAAIEEKPNGLDDFDWLDIPVELEEPTDDIADMLNAVEAAAQSA